MKNLNQEIGNRIKNLRNNLKLSREEFSEKSGISDRFTYDVENGIKGLSADNLLGVANALGVTADYLLTGISNSGDFSAIHEMLSKLDDKDLEYAENILRTFVFAITNKY